MITPSKEFWEIFKKTEGALSCAESIAIMNIAAQAPDGLYLEAGTYKGKSAISAAEGLKQNKFILLEPEIFNREELAYINYNPKNIFYTSIPDYSTSIIPQYENYAYVFIDSGSHQDGLPMREVKLLEDRMVRGGIIAFHDFRSQFVEVEQAYNYLLSTGKYEEIKINWDEINAYVDENNIEEGNSTWHHTEMKNPNFVGAVRKL